MFLLPGTPEATDKGLTGPLNSRTLGFKGEWAYDNKAHENVGAQLNSGPRSLAE